MLIYLKGINSVQLEQVTTFLYKGEASINQQGINMFLETAKELQVKGLLGEFEGFNDRVPEKHTKTAENIQKHDLIDSIISQEHYSFEMGGNIQNDENKQLDFKIEQIVEESLGLWKCKECGKSATTKQQVKLHAEVHIEGVSHSCHICNKLFSTRHHRQVHISRTHKKKSL